MVDRLEFNLDEWNPHPNPKTREWAARVFQTLYGFCGCLAWSPQWEQSGPFDEREVHARIEAGPVPWSVNCILSQIAESGFMPSEGSAIITLSLRRLIQCQTFSAAIGVNSG